MRLFVALELGQDARKLLADCQRRLAAVDRHVRWVRPEQIHLTLKFLGEVPDERVPAVARALDPLGQSGPVTFVMDGAGWFGSARAPRVVWVGIRWPNPALAALQKNCETRLAELGFPPEGRPFHPHLTLGRVREGRGGPEVVPAVDALQAQGVGPLEQTAAEVILFESRLHRDGAQYIRAHAVALRGGENP